MDIKHATTEIELQQIMKDNKQIILLHNDKRYSLSITRRGKLILTASEIQTNS